MTSEFTPLYVAAESSTEAEALTAEQVLGLPPAPDLEDAAQRHQAQKTLAPAASIQHPELLSQTGWAVLYTADQQPAIEQLRPLLTKRKADVGNENPEWYQEFIVPVGVTAKQWLGTASGNKVGLGGSVQPWDGIPYYLLLVGPPESFSFEFEATLKKKFAVGRLYFDDPADYGRYAANVIEYEKTGPRTPQHKNVAVWITCNQNDRATHALTSLVPDEFTTDDHRLGAPNFTLESFVRGKATRPQFFRIVRGLMDQGRPAIIFTGSHGTQYLPTDPRQPEKQGALITQEWFPGSGPLVSGPDGTAGANQFCAADLPDDAQLHGTMFMMFACYSGGCPRDDTFRTNPDGTPMQAAAKDMISKLPQALLSQGALAVLGHVDMATPYSFQDPDGTPQAQVLRDPLDELLKGSTVGMAADRLTSEWSAMASQFFELGPLDANATDADKKERATLTVATHNARNYILLGDPAMRLRLESLS